MQHDKAKPWWQPNVTVYIFFGAVAVLFLFFCSGMHFPIWNGAGRLSDHLRQDLKLTMPAQATVTNSTRVASRDPEEYYSLRMPPADAVAFMVNVRSASHQGSEVDPSRMVSGRLPDWWKPNSLPLASRFDAQHHDSQGGWVWIYSESTGTIYVFWSRI